MALFETENLSFTYPQSNKKALNHVNITINSGEFVLLMGKSGSGKSTLLRLLKQALSPYGTVEGKVAANSHCTGFVLQNPQLSFVTEKVRGELAFALENQGKSHDEISLRIGETASFFDISEILDSELSSLSGGEKATVSIAAAMIGDTDALILDEPLSQLDARSGIRLLHLLKKVNEELGTTVIMASHISDTVMSMCDRLIVLENGKVICDEAPCKAVQKDELLPLFPVSAQLFDERPLTVKAARNCAQNLKEKEPVRLLRTPSDVTAKNITFSYEKHGRDILSGLNFTAYKGRVNSIIGANGSGKTTFLKILAGIIKPYAGKVKAQGRVSYMPQSVRYLFTKEKVKDEINADTAAKLGLGECLESHPFDLSAGQAQRLAFGILLESSPDILLLDEPTRSLDCFNKKILQSYLKELCAGGKTVVMVTHDLDFAGDVSDYVSFLSDGEIVVTGERREVLSSLNFYTSQVRRITRNHLECAVSQEDIL